MFMRRVFLATLAACLAAAAVGAQQPAASRQSSQAKAAEPPEVFCSTMQTGALCPTGTVGILKLSGAKANQWLDAVSRYNKAIEDITKQLRGDAKGILTPAQAAEVNRWFKEGLNPQINRLLASQTARSSSAAAGK